VSNTPAESGGAGAAERAVGGRSRRSLTAAGVAAIGVAAAVLAVARLTSSSGSRRAVNPTATTTATVQRTNLAQTTPVNGTVGFASLVPGGPTLVSIVEPGGSPPSALDQAQQSVASADQSLAADQQAADDANAADAQSLAQAQQSLSTAGATVSSDTTQRDNDQAALAADQQTEVGNCQGGGSAANGGSGSTGSSSGSSGSSSACSADAAQVASDEKTVSADQQKVASDQAAASNAQDQLASTQLKAAETSHQNQAKLNADQLNLSNARSAAADAQTSETDYDQSSKYTALPVAGQVIGPGQPLWTVDGHPVGLLPGTLSQWRTFTAGLTPGPDVATLNQSLIDLGDGDRLTVSDRFTDATAAAIDRLQASLGLPQTGTLTLGSVMFAPTALRVAAVHPQVGAPVTAGEPVLDVTSTTPIVNVALPVDESYLVKVGDPVGVELPDGTTTNGTITAVGTVATTNPSSGPSSGSSSSLPSATINVTVTMPHATGAASLDQAPVTVNITNGTATDVLALPATALLPLAGGGYAVEVVAADGTHHLVPVTIGIFDDQAGMVEVSGAGLAAGQKVVAAA
jgi:multidrug efflux pump subunit AcrA (membrane-fusion protein)